MYLYLHTQVLVPQCCWFIFPSFFYRSTSAWDCSPFCQTRVVKHVYLHKKHNLSTNLHNTSTSDSETLRKTLWFSAWSTILITTCHSISWVPQSASVFASAILNPQIYKLKIPKLSLLHDEIHGDTFGQWTRNRLQKKLSTSDESWCQKNENTQPYLFET